MSRSKEHPRPARLTVRVGVTGHRDLRDIDEVVLRASIRRALSEIAESTHRIQVDPDALELYRPEKPLLRLISPLAEGADRLVADEALCLWDKHIKGFELQCPLPFPREEYRKDFETPDSIAEFEDLLKNATAILELDGPTDEAKRSDAYLAVGRVVLRQCDVLIAVWNGEEAKGGGGTGEVVREALSIELPTIWIRSTCPHDVVLLRSWPKAGEKQDPLSELLKRIRGNFVPPAGVGSAHTEDQHESPGTSEVGRAERFFREAWPRWTWAVAYSLFKKFWTMSLKRTPREPGEAPPPLWILRRWVSTLERWGFRVPDPRKLENQGLGERWQKLFAAQPNLRKHIKEGYLRHYHWADTLANFYANKYRSSFVSTYIMGFFAVLVAFLGVRLHEHNWFWIELVLIGLILLITRKGRGLCWHERWIDYRLLAESLRQMQFLDLFGRVPSSFKVPVHLEVGDPRRSWANWYFRALVREIGMIGGQLNQGYLEASRQVLTDYVKGQVHYHRGNHETSHVLHRRAHKAAEYIFYGALGICILHLIPHDRISFHVPSSVVLLLDTLAVVLPSIGAALAAILHQGEFERIVFRSKTLEHRLTQLQGELDKMPIGGLSSKDLAPIAETFSDIMLAEHVDWRFVFLGKDLTLPA